LQDDLDAVERRLDQITFFESLVKRRTGGGNIGSRKAREIPITGSFDQLGLVDDQIAVWSMCAGGECQHQGHVCKSFDRYMRR
jgi:hypothetical protein